MKPLLIFIFLVFIAPVVAAQDYDPDRINAIENTLSNLEFDVPGLSEKINIELQQSKLSTFLLAIAEVHKINIDVHPELGKTSIINNFKNVAVRDVLVFLCKNQNLSIDVTGSILSIRRFTAPVEQPQERIIPISYNPTTGTLFADLQSDPLAEVFKSISEKSGKGLFFAQGMADQLLTGYIKDIPFEIAMEKMAFSNNLLVTKTKDGSFEFEKMIPTTRGTSGPNGVVSTRPVHSRRANFYFKVLDTVQKRLDIALENVPIADVVYDIGNALQLDIFTAAPLDAAGTATVNAKNISFDQLLTKIFNSAASGSAGVSGGNRRAQGAAQGGLPATDLFSFKVENDVYYFGTTSQLTLRTSEVVPLYYRSIEMLSDPSATGRSVGRTVGFNQQAIGGSNSFGTNTIQNNFEGNSRSRGVSATRSGNAGQFIDLIPSDVRASLSITSDTELNSFIVSGPNAEVLAFKDFIKKIDKPVPVVMIEVMILDVSRSNTLEAGVEWGIGEQPATTQGLLFPHSQVTLGANTVNRILGRIDGSSFFNIGKVVPNFYANIKAMESNGFLKVRSSPRITTLNGHRAYFSNGETSYYAVTNQTFIGSQNPTTSEITNYQPIDAELSLDVKPFVSADGEITMDIKVIQSSFNGERIAQDAPPGINSREFTSIVKARNNDIVVLGGLEERRRSNTGTGVPFLARIPIIKWLFSKRVREGSKSKLTVLIKPTVIY